MPGKIFFFYGNNFFFGFAPLPPPPPSPHHFSNGPSPNPTCRSVDNIYSVEIHINTNSYMLYGMVISIEARMVAVKNIVYSHMERHVL